MSTKYEKLKTLLKELFQLDQPDLDFGLYRIMHAKSVEVSQFLDKDLLPQVKDAFALYQNADKALIEEELARVVTGIEAAGMDPEQSPKVAELRERLANEVVNVGQLESEVYDHLFSFFRRYYSEGDFLSKRVYKPGVYAIPYEGEEVKLHWANADQYYIKTSEYLRDYAFRLRPDDESKPMRVHFRLVDAAEGEHGNVKATAGKDRRFKLVEAGAVSLEDGELIVRFTYQPNPSKQKDLNTSAEAQLLAAGDPTLAEWIAALGAKHRRGDGTTSDNTRLRVHLDRYTARNTFDYFIHKDLGTFLRRELDFYVKNEVMHLDDIERESAPRVEQYLSKVKVIRKIAGKIIDFLAQLEDFQRKLWLKKKFVVETHYYITLDRVPEVVYSEIAACEEQREEWVDLLCIDDLDGYSVPLEAMFLRENQSLPVNTSLLDPQLAARLLDEVTGDNPRIDGTLVHSDNFQALRLLGRALSAGVRCVYIDPPYNTAVSSIPYKNDYKHSSFASMISDRAKLLRDILEDRGVLFVSIDKHERNTVEFALDNAFGRSNRIEELIWLQNTNDGRAPTYSVNHEYVEVYARDATAVESDPRIFREPKPGVVEVLELTSRLNPEYPSVEKIEAELTTLYKNHRLEYRNAVEAEGLNWEEEKRTNPWNGVYMYRFAEYRDERGRFVPEEDARDQKARIWVYSESDWTIMSSARKQSSTTADPEHPNYRFYVPKHPRTGRPVSMPSRGWKGRRFEDPEYPARNTWQSLTADHRIAFGEDESKVPRQKRFLHEVETNVAKSIFREYADGERETTELFGRTGVFLAPKHSRFVRRFLDQVVESNSIVLDCFGGSGSTAHAVLAVNRDEGRELRYALVEVSDYFDEVLVPRILKAAYSQGWKAGAPVDRSGLSQVVKVLRLESYEDALNNLELRRTDEQQTVLDLAQTQGVDSLRESFLLRYMLDIETRGSQSLLNVAAFTDPTAYKLKIKHPGSDESRVVNVDLLETFNWLIGLTVKRIGAPQTFCAAFERDSEGRLRLEGRLRQETDGPFWFRTVTGGTPDGRNTLVIWRKLTGDREEDNLVLDEWFTKQGYSSKDSEFDLIYVNGGTNLENLKTPDDLWKVRLIEEDFHRLMFETEGV